MDCEKFDRVLMDLLYDELDELTRAAAARHIDHCQRCRGQLGALKTTREAGALALVAAPEGFEQRVLAAELAARQGLPWAQRMGRWWTIATGYAMRPQLAMAALLMLMIGSSLLLLRPKPGSHASIQVTERGTPRNNVDQVVVPLGEEQSAPNDTPSPPDGEPAAPPAPEPEAEQKRAQDNSAVPPHTPPSPMLTGTGVGTPNEAQMADEAIRKAEDDAFDAAVAAYKNRELDRAQVLFDEIVKSGGRKAAEAELYAALATQQAQGCSAALPRFDSVSAHQVRNERGYQAKWHSATCRLSTGETKRALLDLQSLVDVPQYRSRAQQALNNWHRSGGAQARSGLQGSPIRTLPPGPPPQTGPGETGRPTATPSPSPVSGERHR